MGTSRLPPANWRKWRRIKSSFGPPINQSLYLPWNQISRNQQRHLASLLCRTHLKKLQVLKWERADGKYLAIAHRGLHRAQAAFLCHHNMHGRGDAGRHIKRAFLLVMGDRRIAIKIKPVGDLPFYVEGGHRLGGRYAKFRQAL